MEWVRIMSGSCRSCGETAHWQADTGGQGESAYVRLCYTCYDMFPRLKHIRPPAGVTRCESVHVVAGFAVQCDGGFSHFGGHAGGTRGNWHVWPFEGPPNCLRDHAPAFCYTKWINDQNTPPVLSANALLKALEDWELT